MLHGRLSLMLGAGLTPRLRHTISVGDDRPPSKQAARRAPPNSAVASAARLEGRPGPVTPSTKLRSESQLIHEIGMREFNHLSHWERSDRTGEAKHRPVRSG